MNGGGSGSRETGRNVLLYLTLGDMDPGQDPVNRDDLENPDDLDPVSIG